MEKNITQFKFSRLIDQELPKGVYQNAQLKDVDEAMQAAQEAFYVYRKKTLKQRADFMRTIAIEINALGDRLIHTAMQETHLAEARLRSELSRTIFQLNSYAEACEHGNWLQARIDTAKADSNPPKPDIRKMMVPIGPVVIFGASNFPFAYSTAGGDTACAFAAGCPVVVKAHSAHLQTSEMIAQAIIKAAGICHLPEGVFAHIHSSDIKVAQELVKHPNTKAVGFTGSYSGGKALFDIANQRAVPIPVFAEMGSINPVFLLPEKLAESASDIAKMYTTSITQSVGQFCTNPGLIIGVESAYMELFMKKLANEIKLIEPEMMLHENIAKAYNEKKNKALVQEGVSLVAESTINSEEATLLKGVATIATVSAAAFLNNPVLHQEVFGPYSIIVRCKNIEEMLQVAKKMEGQLTATIMATESDVKQHDDLIESVKDICGRIIMNGVPTGVEVCLSMQHGGPFPATTDSRFTSVGADGIQRFTRPVAYQNWAENLLPVELRIDNPLGIWRIVNNEFTKK